MDAMVFVEIKACEGLGKNEDDSVHCLFQFLIASARVAIGCLIEAGVSHDGCPPRPANGGDRLVARQADRRLAQSSEQAAAATKAEQTQEVLVAIHMPIQRWLAHAEFLGNACQRQCSEALFVDEDARGVHDSILV